MNKLRTAKKSAIFLLGALVVLLAVSFLPLGTGDSEKYAAKEKAVLLEQFSELGNLPPAAGEAEKSFVISEKGIKGIRFVDEIETWYNLDDQIIRVSKNADAELLNKVMIYNEFGHAKVFDAVGDFKK